MSSRRGTLPGSHDSCEGGGHTGAALAMLDAGQKEHVGSHLIHAFLASFGQTQLLQLQVEVHRRAPVRLGQFLAAVRKVCPHIRLTDTDRRPSTIGGQEALEREQDAMLAELFDQLDADDDQIVTWSDFSSLLFSTSSTDRKHKLLTYNETPTEPHFPYQSPHKAGRAQVQLLNAVSSSRVDEALIRSADSEKRSLGPLGRRVQGAGLYWEDVEKMKYFPALRLFCLTGGQDAYLFTVDADGSAGSISAKLTGPTAALFNVYHFPRMRRVVGCCADRYLYTWSDSHDKWTVNEAVKTATPQLCAAYDEAHAILLTGGTDGAILVFPTEPRLQHATQRVPSDAQEWLTDMLMIAELQQLVTCAADGRITLWDTGWDEATKTVTGLKVRSQKDGQGRCVRTQVAYANRYRMLLSVGCGHNITCWNPFIVSHTHHLKGHDKVLTQVHAFDLSPEVISADVSGRVIIWDIRSMAAVQSVGGPDSRCPIGFVSAFAFNASTNQIVTVGKKLCVYNSATRQSPRTLDARISLVLYNPAQKTLVASCGARVFLFHVGTGELRAVFNNVTRSDITCMAFSHNRKELFVGNVDGEIRIVTIPNGNWLQEITTADAIVGLFPITQQLYQTQRALQHQKYTMPDKKSDDPHMLLTITQGGGLSVWFWGRVGEEAEVVAWRSMLDSLGVAAFSSATGGAFVASKCRAEVWSVGTQQVRRTFRCSSPITSGCFCDEINCLVIAEQVGVLHFYASSGFVYLLRFSFLSPFTAVQLQFLPDQRKQLMCVSEGGIKVLSLRSILDRFHTQNDAKTWLAELGDLRNTVMHNDRYVAARGRRCADKPQLGLDMQTGRRVHFLVHATAQAAAKEAAVLASVAGCESVVSHLGSFDMPDTGLRCNVLDAWDGHLPALLRTLSSGSRQDVRDPGSRGPRSGQVVDERQWVVRCCAQALQALHERGVVVLLCPGQVVRHGALWKVSDASFSVATDHCDVAGLSGCNTLDVGRLRWRDLPPELASVKWDLEQVERARRKISQPAGGRKSIRPKADPKMVGETGWDLWGLGLVAWLLYSGRPLWGEGTPDIEIADLLLGKTASLSSTLPPRSRDMPEELQANMPIRELLDNLLTTKGRRWNIQRVAAHMQTHNFLGRRQEALRPFPVGLSAPVRSRAAPNMASPLSAGSRSSSSRVFTASTSGSPQAGQFENVLDLAEVGPFALPDQLGEPPAQLSAEESRKYAARWFTPAVKSLSKDGDTTGADERELASPGQAEQVFSTFVAYEVSAQVHPSITAAVASPEPCVAIFVAEWDTTAGERADRDARKQGASQQQLAFVSAVNLASSRSPMSLGHLPLRQTLKELGLQEELGGSRWTLGRLMAMHSAAVVLRREEASAPSPRRSIVRSRKSDATPFKRRKRGHAVAQADGRDESPRHSTASEKWAFITEAIRQEETREKIRQQAEAEERDSARSTRSEPKPPPPPPLDPTEHLSPFFAMLRTCVGTIPAVQPFYMNRARSVECTPGTRGRTSQRLRRGEERRDAGAVEELSKGKRRLGLDFLMKESRPSRLSYQDQERLLADMSRELSAVALAKQLAEPQAHVDGVLFVRPPRVSDRRDDLGAVPEPDHSNVGLSFRKAATYKPTSVRTKMQSIEREEEEQKRALEHADLAEADRRRCGLLSAKEAHPPARQTLRSMLAMTDEELSERRREATIRRVASIVAPEELAQDGAQPGELSRRMSCLVTGTLTASLATAARTRVRQRAATTSPSTPSRSSRTGSPHSVMRIGPRQRGIGILQKRVTICPPQHRRNS